MENFDILLESSAAAHGHICPGQAVGVRMAMLGCRLIGLDKPTSRDQIKKLLVYVEMDRCTADAVAHVTGVKLGRRSLKFVDYGIMAATFVNLETNIYDAETEKLIWSGLSDTVVGGSNEVEIKSFIKRIVGVFQHT